MADEFHTPERLAKMRELGLLKDVPGAPSVSQLNRPELNYMMQTPVNPQPEPAPPTPNIIPASESAVNALQSQEPTGLDLTQIQSYDPTIGMGEVSGELATPPKTPNFDDLYDESAYQDIFAKKQEALEMASSAGQAAAEAEASYLGTLQDNLANQQKQNQVREVARQKQMEEQGQKLEQAVGAFESAKVDPKRMWASMQNGQKALTGVAMALGAFGAAYNGGNNQAATLIRKAVDDDIQLQKAEIQKLGDVVTAKRSVLQDMRALFDDERQAESAAKLAMINQAEIGLKQMAAQYKSPQIQANAMTALADLELQKEQIKAKFMESANLMALKAGNDAANVPDEYREQYVVGYGIAPSKEEAKEFRAQLFTAQKTKARVGKLLSLVDSGAEFSPATRAEASTTATFLKGALRQELVGPGAVTDREQALLDKIVANPATLTSLDSQSKASLKRIIEIVDDGLKARAQSLNMAPMRKQVRTRAPQS